jgi:hypothetical protein
MKYQNIYIFRVNIKMLLCLKHFEKVVFDGIRGLSQASPKPAMELNCILVVTLRELQMGNGSILKIILQFLTVMISQNYDFLRIVLTYFKKGA